MVDTSSLMACTTGAGAVVYPALKVMTTGVKAYS
jgi:hypothetical protein